MIMKRLGAIALLFVASLFQVSVFGQGEVERVKADPEHYYSAEGMGITVEEASNDALRNIVNQIATFVEYEISHKSLDIGGNESTKDEIKLIVKSFASLRDVKAMTLSMEPEARVFRWVSKDEVDRMFEMRKQKIRDLVETGKIAESRLQIDDALRNYYWALRLAQVAFENVYVTFDGKEVNCRTFLPVKINSVISNLKAELKECSYENDRYLAKMHFTYNGQDVSSLALSYHDGQSFVGPLVAKDGVGELDLVSLKNGKIGLRYEYMFIKQGISLDKELESAFEGTKTVLIENDTQIPVKVDRVKNTVKVDKKFKNGVSISSSGEAAAISPEPARQKKRIELEVVENTEEYVAILKDVERAIRDRNPKEAYSHFTLEGYKLFDTLLSKSGVVSLVGKTQNYEFVRASEQIILARYCNVKIRHRNGKTFMENIVFRFNEQEKKIESLAFALTKKAEDDIFNAAAFWSGISRFTILRFMEDYQTAYALKRADYIERIFSEDALIIVGSMLKKSESSPDNQGGKTLSNFCSSKDDVRYNKLSKSQYLANVRKSFKREDYVHLTFEDNKTKAVNAPSLPESTAFAIQIKQVYDSPSYSDCGYLTLMLDVSEELPIIHVRFWQPQKDSWGTDPREVMSVDKFIGKWAF